MYLVRPSVEFKASFIEALREYQSDNSPRSRTYRDMSVDELEADFASYVARERAKEQGLNLPVGWVPETTLWLIDHETYIGRVSIRHMLTDKLLTTGGHIGYDVRPSMRRKGYGRAMLALAVPFARDLGIKRALITCDSTNVASRKIIEHNGGVLENAVRDSESGAEKLRFWIDL